MVGVLSSPRPRMGGIDSYLGIQHVGIELESCEQGISVAMFVRVCCYPGSGSSEVAVVQLSWSNAMQLTPLHAFA